MDAVNGLLETDSSASVSRSTMVGVERRGIPPLLAILSLSHSVTAECQRLGRSGGSEVSRRRMFIASSQCTSNSRL